MDSTGSGLEPITGYKQSTEHNEANVKFLSTQY